MIAGFTPEEAEKLLGAFKELEVKPKADNPSELMSWMKDFVDTKTGLHATATTGSPGAMPRQILTNQIRLPVFSGDGKGDTTFDLWKYEVNCLLRDSHTEDTVRQAIRRSLRGEAGRIAMRLGPEASVTAILRKMESVYGEVEQKELRLAKFYSAQQEKDEEVSSWGCRLEDLLSKASETAPLAPTEAENMLRVMFWSGLRSDLKDITGHLYDTIRDFDRLRVAIRRVEQDHKRRLDNDSTTTKKAGHCKSSVTPDQQPFTELKGMIQQLTSEVQTLKATQEEMKGQLYSPQQTAQPRQYGGQRQNQPRQNQRRQGNRQQQHMEPEVDRPQANREPEHPFAGSHDSDFTCWRCGQIGHISLGCRVRLDHMRRGPLNDNRPVRGGKH